VEEIKNLKNRLSKAESMKGTSVNEKDNEPTVRNSAERYQEEIKMLTSSLKQAEKDKKELQKQLLNEVNFSKQLQVKNKATDEMKAEGKSQLDSLRAEIDQLELELESTKAKLSSALSTLDINERKYRECQSAMKDIVEDPNIQKLIQEELQDDKLTDPIVKLSILPNALGKFIRQQRQLIPELPLKSISDPNKSRAETNHYRDQLKETEARYENLLVEMKRLKVDHENEVKTMQDRLDQLESELPDDVSELRRQLADALATAAALREANAILEDARHDDATKSRDLRRREEQLKEAENRLFKLREKLQEKDKSLKEREDSVSSKQFRKVESNHTHDDKASYLVGDSVKYSHFLEKLNNKDLVDELINTLPRDSQLALYLQNREGDPREPKAVCDELR
jgi:uncharacterized phage infection (PIP) family protein YhgE